MPHIGSASLDVSRKVPCGLPDEARLTDDITALAEEFGRYGYRMITGLLNNSGCHVNHKRVERIRRQEGREASRKNSRIRADFGSMTGHASGCGRSARTMSGPMTLSRTGPTTASLPHSQHHR